MDLGERSGNRAVGIGEAPYLDPESQARADALGVKKAPSKVAVPGAMNSSSLATVVHASHSEGPASKGVLFNCVAGAGCPMANGTTVVPPDLTAGREDSIAGRG